MRRYQGGWQQFVYFIVVLVLSIVLAPKPPKPRPAALEDFDVPVAEEDRPIPVVFGTWRVTGANVLWYGDLSTTKIKKSSLFSSTTIGYRYHLGMHLGFCHGPVDEFSKLEVADKEAWSGSITANTFFDVIKGDLFGGEKREGGLNLRVNVEFGEPDQEVSAYLASKQDAPVPAYRGVFCLTSITGTADYTGGTPIENRIRSKLNLGYVGTTPYVKPWAATIKRILKGWNTDVWYSEKAEVTLPDGATGMNPAHIIYQCLTDPEWGMGADGLTEIDDDAFRAVADACFDEGFGLNLLWNQQTTCEDFIGIVLDHIAGILAFDHRTAKYVVKLIRGDYDPASLPIFDESNLAEVSSLERRSWGETVNELTLSYTSPETGKATAMIVQDLGNLRSQGTRIPEKADFTGIRDHTLMKSVAGRELAARSTPLARIEFKALRAFWEYGPGSVVRVRWAAHNLPLTVFRILGVRGGTLQSGYISVNAVEDIYALPGIEYQEVEPVVDPGEPPATPDDTADNSGSILGTLSTPPDTGIMDGDRWLIGPGATGAWTGHEGQIAEADLDGDQWQFSEPTPGALIFDESTGSHFSIDENGDVTTAPWTPAIPPLTEQAADFEDLLPFYDASVGEYRKATVSSLVGSRLRTVGATWNGGGTAIETPINDVHVRVPFAGEIVSATVFGDLPSGSCVIDIWKDSYGNYPPDVADSITASAKPTISATNKNQDTTLTGWTKNIAAGDFVTFHLESANTFKVITILLSVRETTS